MPYSCSETTICRVPQKKNTFCDFVMFNSEHGKTLDDLTKIFALFLRLLAKFRFSLVEVLVFKLNKIIVILIPHEKIVCCNAL